MGNNEYEVGIKDLIYALLLKWKTILIVAFCSALLLGGVIFLKRIDDLRDQETILNEKVVYEEALLQYNNKKSIYERDIRNISISLETYEKYIDESILLKINALNKPISSADLYITTDYQIMPGMLYQNRDYTDSIIRAYANLIRQGDFYDEDNLIWNGLDLTYLRELIKVTEDYNNKMLRIELTYTDIEKANEMLQNIIDSLMLQTDNITNTIGLHKIQVVNRANIYNIDEELVQLQNNKYKTKETMQNLLFEQKKHLKDLSEPTYNEPSILTALKSSFKYGIFGGALGGFFVTFLICISILTSDKILFTQEFYTRFKLPVLGTFALSEKISKISLLYKKICHISNSSSDLTHSQTFALISANLLNYTVEDVKVITVGTIDSMTLSSVTEQLKFSNQSRQFIHGGNLLTESVVLNKLPECDAVILVEKRGESMRCNVIREIEIINRLNKQIIGFVLY